MAIPCWFVTQRYAQLQPILLLVQADANKDMPTSWSRSVVTQFDTQEHVNSSDECPSNGESNFYGPYNTLLYEYFPAEENYQIAPRYNRITDNIEFTVFYVIRKQKIPVFFMEVKDYDDIHIHSSRADTDGQMRKRLVGFWSESIRIPKIYGLSAMGASCAFYEMAAENSQSLPLRIAPDPRFLVDTAPEEWWKYYIMNDDGEAKLEEIVAEIKEMVEDLKL